MGSSSALRDLQRELETKADDLSKLQKGKCDPHCSLLIFISFLQSNPNPNHSFMATYVYTLLQTLRRTTKSERSILSSSAKTSSSSRSVSPNSLEHELDLLNEDANVYKLIGPVLVKQDLAEANANVRKRIDYMSAELKRLDAILQDLEEKQNGKKDTVEENDYSINGEDFDLLEEGTYGNKVVWWSEEEVFRDPSLSWDLWLLCRSKSYWPASQWRSTGLLRSLRREKTLLECWSCQNKGGRLLEVRLNHLNRRGKGCFMYSRKVAGCVGMVEKLAEFAHVFTFNFARAARVQCGFIS
ncbi:hypothetical protein U1Q18_009556 [Sarracenia purpurea var. burkii]